MTSARTHKGKTSYHAGEAAEQAVARDYTRRGYDVLAQRWRGSGGEIDLICKRADGYVFVEVKKSSTFARAALRISKAQKLRIFAAANEFVATQPLGLLSDMRFDVALVDAAGCMEFLENALLDT